MISALKKLMTEPLAQMIQDGSIVAVAGAVVLLIGIVTMGIRLGWENSEDRLEDEKQKECACERCAAEKRRRCGHR